MPVYTHQLKGWPNFSWDQEKIATKLAAVRYQQGRLLGRMEGMGSGLQMEANIRILTLDMLASSEMEGVILDPDLVRAAVVRRLGMDIAVPGDLAVLAPVDPATPAVEGIVEMMLDATQNYAAPLTHKRLFGWHAVLFPTEHRDVNTIVTGRYHDHAPDQTRTDMMEAAPGRSGRGKVHFQAPHAELLEEKMTRWMIGFNRKEKVDPVLKAAMAHWWFMTLHPFGEGNGRIARAITDMQLCRADCSAQRFYSLSPQMRTKQKEYYHLLEKTQKASLDITAWLDWFLDCFDHAITGSEEILAAVLKKSRFWERHFSMPLNDRQRMMLNKLLDGFDGRLTSSVWAGITASSQDTAGRDINELVQRGILVKEAAGGRSTRYLLAG